tara:strand:- start:594 stop:758 length:165 start_codon:yes stop_codon:yes gene_type:complete
MDKQLISDLEDLREEIQCWAEWIIQEKIDELIKKYNKPPAKALTRDEICFEGED